MTRTLRTYDNQVKAMAGLKGYVGVGQVTDLGQALNHAYDGKGKDSGSHVVDGVQRQVLHASAGKTGADVSVTLFYYFENPSGSFHLVALGEHTKVPGQYLIDKELGQDQAPFQKKKVGPQGG
ncbi:hypothetical protein [Streptomyces sp. NPDC096323]|uniref:hypothetical protein n=1 Tax=Streptomyces sp. NPDC096323 TaxID=3155822 RepID=UPI003326D4EE